VPRDAYFAIADEAKRQGLPFVGHVPELITAVEASDAGQRSMEHSMGIWQSCSTAEPQLRKFMAEALRDPKAAPDYIWGRVEFGLPPRGTLDTFSGKKASRLFSGGLMDQRGMNLVPQAYKRRGIFQIS
jgi:hypothetical protein